MVSPGYTPAPKGQRIPPKTSSSGVSMYVRQHATGSRLGDQTQALLPTAVSRPKKMEDSNYVIAYPKKLQAVKVKEKKGFWKITTVKPKDSGLETERDIEYHYLVYDDSPMNEWYVECRDYSAYRNVARRKIDHRQLFLGNIIDVWKLASLWGLRPLQYYLLRVFEEQLRERDERCLFEAFWKILAQVYEMGGRLDPRVLIDYFASSEAASSTSERRRPRAILDRKS